MFDVMIWAGAALTLVGMAVLIWCILRVAKAKRASLGDEALRAAIQSVLPLNLAALFVSVLGLMLVVVGIILG